MKVGISLPANLLAFADEEAVRRGITRAGLLAHLLEVEQTQAQVRTYIGQHGWDVVVDEASLAATPTGAGGRRVP